MFVVFLFSCYPSYDLVRLRIYAVGVICFHDVFSVNDTLAKYYEEVEDRISWLYPRDYNIEKKISVSSLHTLLKLPKTYKALI